MLIVIMLKKLFIDSFHHTPMGAAMFSHVAMCLLLASANNGCARRQHGTASHCCGIFH